MVINKKELTEIELYQKYREIYRVEKVLGGIISWWTKVKVDKIRKDLIIETSEEYDDIIINGKKLNKI